jgi:hypothetical protein
MYDKELDFNYFSTQNNVKVHSTSSFTRNCPASNVINQDRKTIWMSEGTCPQWFIIDFCAMIKKPKTHFKYFGIYTWHAYGTNPKVIELQFSKDNKTYLSYGKYDLALKPGSQFFEIRNNQLLEQTQSSFKFLKVIVKETYGNERCYMNQFYMFEDLSGAGGLNSCNYTQNSILNNKDALKTNFKTDSQSLFLGGVNHDEEEEEASVLPSSITNNNNSTLKPSNNFKNRSNKSLNNDPLQYENKSTKSKSPINMILEEPQSQFQHNENEDNSENLIYDGNNHENMNYKKNDKKLKKIENIIKNKLKKIEGKKRRIDDESEVKSEDEEFEGEGYQITSEDDRKSPIQKRKKYEVKKESPKSLLYSKLKEKRSSSESPIRHVSSSIKNNKIRNSNKTKFNQSSPLLFEENNEYKQLENQLKEMDEHIKSMDLEYNEGMNKYGNIHSKSFSFLNNNNYQTNPFINKGTAGLYSNMNSNKHSLYNFNNIETPVNLHRAGNIPNQTNNNSNILSNYLFSNSQNPEEANIHQNNLINNGNSNLNTNLTDKMQKIEEKICSFEKDISDIKNNFNKLLDNINKLIDSGLMGNVNQMNSKNSFENINNNVIPNQANNQQPNNDEMLNIILNECSRMINDRLNLTYEKKSTMRSARKSEFGDNNMFNNENNYDFEQSKFIIKY